MYSYTCIHTHVHTYHTHMSEKDIYIHIYPYTYINILSQTHIHRYIVYTHAYMCLHTCTHIHTQQDGKRNILLRIDKNSNYILVTKFVRH